MSKQTFRFLLAIFATIYVRCVNAADIEPIIIKLTSTATNQANTWAVPTGHTLVVSYVQHENARGFVQLTKDDVHVVMALARTNETINLGDQEGIRIPEGYTLSALKTNVISTIYVIGNLVLTERLYGGEPILISLSSQNGTPQQMYTVPPGKHIKIRQIAWTGSGALTVSNDTMSFEMPYLAEVFFQLYLYYFSGSFYTGMPIIPSGWTIGLKGSGTACIFASLASDSDLIVSNPTEIENYSISGDGARAIVSLAYPVPSKIVVEKSGDMSTWVGVNAEAIGVVGANSYQVVWPVGDEDRAYYRGRAFLPL